MIECPFCGETFEEEDLVYEFSWGEVATYFYNKRQLPAEPKNEFRDRPFYITLKYDWHGNAQLDSCSTSVNPQKHPSNDPMTHDDNGWARVVHLLSGRRIFEALCSDDDKSLPTGARILPMIKYKKKHAIGGDGMSTGVFCPICEQHLKPEVLRAESEVRIVLSGRPGSGKTVYVTQMISELMQGRLAQEFTIEAANNSVQTHYRNNKDLLKALGSGFVLATNPGAVQDPYIFLMKNDKSSIRLVIQDIAGEDVENRTKYSRAVRKADMLLFFIDPWHIEEIRIFHKRNNDPSNTIVERSTKGRYTSLSGVFQQMMSTVDREFTEKSGQLAGMLLIKGDYLDPPMLAQGVQPECQMMREPIPFNDPEAMGFSIGMRSSFIRQCLHEWDGTRSFARDVESKYPAHNIRYFVSSALGQSTHLRQDTDTDADFDAENHDDPNAQFSVGGGAAASSAAWNYGEQVLESPARPMNVIDPVFWCLKRKGIRF